MIASANPLSCTQRPASEGGASPAWYPQDSRAEWLADTVVHVAGSAFALVGGVWLIVVAQAHGDPRLTTGLVIYVAGLLAMLGCSSLYNINTDKRLRDVYERLDLSAIFLKIAATYTPFMLITLGNWWALAFLGAIWTLALTGVALKLIVRVRSPKLYIALYLVLGWLGIAAVKPLVDAVSPTGLGFLATGGVLYTLGVVFHVDERREYNSAIWHCFVIAAAACHFAAVYHEIAALA